MKKTPRTEPRQPAQPQAPAAAIQGPSTGGYVVRDRRATAEPHETTPPTASEAPSPPSSAELARLQQELQQAKEESLRAMAEFENATKRLQREKEESIKYAAQTLVRGLLPIMDSLDHALVAVDKQSDPQAIIKGIPLIYRELLGLLSRQGVQRIEAVGEPFDPHRHEAIAQVEGDGTIKDDTIVEEVQVGYTLHGKVLRPAMVKVAKKSSPQSIVDSSQTRAQEEHIS